MVLGQRVRKVQDNRVHKEKGLIKYKVRGQREHQAREARSTSGTKAVRHKTRGAQEYGGHEIREAWEYSTRHERHEST